MKKFLSVFVLALAFTSFNLKASAQDGLTANHTINVTIPNVALIDLESASTTTIGATFVAPTEAGDDLTDPTPNTDIWLNYTSVLSSAATSRRIDVKASQVVPGVTMKIGAGNAAAGYVGTVGTPASAPLTLSASDQPIITGITSAYTVSGATKGHNLTYSFEVDETAFGSLKESTPSVTVTFTLVDI